MMLPDQEAALRSADGQRLYAQAVLDGLRAYLEDRAARPPEIAGVVCGPGDGVS